MLEEVTIAELVVILVVLMGEKNNLKDKCKDVCVDLGAKTYKKLNNYTCNSSTTASLRTFCIQRLDITYIYTCMI